MVKVKLTEDLTKYDRRLVVGEVGETTGPCSMWARGSDRFTGVKFVNGAHLDVLWKGLELIETAEEKEEYDRCQTEILKSAQNIEVYLGPYSGLKRIHYEYSNKGTKHSVSNYDRSEIERLTKIFTEMGLPITEYRELTKKEKRENPDKEYIITRK